GNVTGVQTCALPILLMRPAGNSQGEWLLTVKATVNVGTSCLSESSSCSLLNMSSSDAPHVPTKLGFLNVCISCSSLKPLERKKPFMLSKCASPPYKNLDTYPCGFNRCARVKKLC